MSRITLSYVYHWRWQHETYHQMLKGRLDLENWSGLTVEAVRQDVQAAVLVSNLESLLSQPAQEALQAGNAQQQYPAQVDRAVNYHALKERMLDLLWSDRPTEQVLLELRVWMQSNPVAVRPNRKVPRGRRQADHWSPGTSGSRGYKIFAGRTCGGRFERVQPGWGGFRAGFVGASQPQRRGPGSRQELAGRSKRLERPTILASETHQTDS